MESILLYTGSENVVRLEFLDAVHPTLVHQRAEHWNFIYQMYHGETLLDPGLYNNNYFICEERQILVIEEYDSSILDKENIQKDEDVMKNLRLFDFRNRKTGRFSRLTGHSFLLQRLTDNNFIFSKQYADRTAEFEIDITSIPLANF